MNPWKSSLAALVLLGGLGGTAQAQQGNAPSRGDATYPGAGTNGDYYSITNGFGPSGLPGTYPRYQGYGLSGYGPGSILNEYFVPWPGPRTPQTATTRPAPTKATPSKSSAARKSAGSRMPVAKNPPRK